MNYRLIACDMDGTLLNSENKITTRTVEAIKAAKEKGVVFTLSTGRPVQGVEKYIDLLDLDCPVITYNGAVIVHSRSGEIIFSQNMDNDDARTVYNEAVKRGTMFLVWSQNKLYVSECYATPGMTMKRIMPRAQGRAFRILKRTSHITVVVRERD